MWELIISLSRYVPRDVKEKKDITMEPIEPKGGVTNDNFDHDD